MGLYRVCFDENVLQLNSDDVAQLCEYSKSHKIINFNFMVLELYLNRTVILKK